MSKQDVVDSLHIYTPAIGKMTPKGYGVALAHPIEQKGVICWFRDRRAYIDAGQDASARRQAGMDASELYLADELDIYPNGDDATRALLEYGRDHS